MRRRVLVIPLARAQIGRLVDRLKSTPINKSTEHLKLAWEILRDDLKITEKNARELIAGSLSAAQVCAEAINRRSENIVESKSRAKTRGAFKRLANCYGRASLKLRSRLDEAIGLLLRQDRVDLEVIEEILDAAAAEFQRFFGEDAAATALRAMFVTVQGREPNNWVKNDYACLSPYNQRNCEAALSKLRKKRKAVSAGAVFEVLASALDAERTRKADPEVSTLICNYVATVASMWRSIGLHPSRARDPKDPTYKSKFHRFSDLILTALAEPWTYRHDGNLELSRKKVFKARAELPDEFRRVSAALRQCDEGWLVSEHILRRALRLQVQKSGRQTP